MSANRHVIFAIYYDQAKAKSIAAFSCEYTSLTYYSFPTH